MSENVEEGTKQRKKDRKKMEAWKNVRKEENYLTKEERQEKRKKEASKEGRKKSRKSVKKNVVCRSVCIFCALIILMRSTKERRNTWGKRRPISKHRPRQKLNEVRKDPCTDQLNKPQNTDGSAFRPNVRIQPSFYAQCMHESPHPSIPPSIHEMKQ